MPRLSRDQAKNSGRVKGSIRRRQLIRLSRLRRAGADPSPLCFVAVVAAVNFFEFGRID
jgi:hypothetical protein